MFRRWLQRSNRLQHETPEARLAAIAALSDEQVQAEAQTLANMATSDDNLAVRECAIQNITDVTLLEPLLDDPNVGTTCAEQIVNLLRQQQPSTHSAPSCANHSKILQAEISTATEADLTTLLGKLIAPEDLAELALRFKAQAREKILAHPLFGEEQGLNVLEKTSRSRDKYCNRFARAQLEQIKTTRQGAKDCAARITELDASINKELKSAPQEPDAVIAQRTKLAKLGKNANPGAR